MIKHWIASYERLTYSARFLSQGASFILVIISLLSFGEFSIRLVRFADGWYWRENQSNIVIAVVFHLLILSIFMFRFLVLMQPNTRRLWFAQILWLLGLISIYGFIVVTRGSFFANPNDPVENCIDCFYFSTFRYASATYTVIFLFYPWLSMFKEFVLSTMSLGEAISTKSNS